MTYKNPDTMTDKELYESYQKAKENGPVPRIDELQLEICERWESHYLTGSFE